MENFYLTNDLKPFIYTISVMGNDKGVENKSVMLNPERERFKMPDRLYGDTEEEALHIFGYYVFNNKDSQGCLFIGDAGAGKTLLAERVCNIALENKVPVIYIHSQPSDNAEAIVKWLGTVHDCVVYIDEFGKQISTWVQDKLLTTLSDKSKKVLWILTENSVGKISNYILNRPGRSHYQYVFNKIKERVVIEYCQDELVDDEFVEKILEKLSKSKEFTFDHLRGIVNEYKYCKHMIAMGSKDTVIDIDKFIERLNIKHLSHTFTMNVSECKLRGELVSPSDFGFTFSSPTFKVYSNKSSHEGITERTFRNMLESPNTIRYEFAVYASILESEVGKKLLEAEPTFKDKVITRDRVITKLKGRGLPGAGKHGEIVFENDYFEIRLVLIDEL